MWFPKERNLSGRTEKTRMNKEALGKGCISLVIILLSVLIIGRVAGGEDLKYRLKDRSGLGPLTREDIDYKEAEAPEPTSKDGTINASDWSAVYPEIVMTMGSSKENSYVIDYLEQDPYLTNIYEGYGFAKDYGSARGHEYCLEDVAATERPHPKANCLTCKTPNFAKLVNDQGVGVYSMDFNEVMGMMEENPSCYTYGKAAIAASVEPVVATLIGVFIFRETMTAGNLAGIFMVLAAIVLANRREKQNRC